MASSAMSVAINLLLLTTTIVLATAAEDVQDSEMNSRLVKDLAYINSNHPNQDDNKQKLLDTDSKQTVEKNSNIDFNHILQRNYRDTENPKTKKKISKKDCAAKGGECLPGKRCKGTIIIDNTCKGKKVCCFDKTKKRKVTRKKINDKSNSNKILLSGKAKKISQSGNRKMVNDRKLKKGGGKRKKIMKEGGRKRILIKDGKIIKSSKAIKKPIDIGLDKTSLKKVQQIEAYNGREAVEKRDCEKLKKKYKRQCTKIDGICRTMSGGCKPNEKSDSEKCKGASCTCCYKEKECAANGGECLKKKRCKGTINTDYTCKGKKVCCFDKPTDCAANGGECLPKKRCKGTFNTDYTCKGKKVCCFECSKPIKKCSKNKGQCDLECTTEHEERTWKGCNKPCKCCTKCKPAKKCKQLGGSKCTKTCNNDEEIVKKGCKDSQNKSCKLKCCVKQCKPSDSCIDKGGYCMSQAKESKCSGIVLQKECSRPGAAKPEKDKCFCCAPGIPTPQRTTPHLTTPQHTTPHHTTPHHTTPHLTTPHHTTPHHTTPHYTTPHLTTPHHTTPHHTTPHHTTPHLTTPHHTTPHLTTPHHTTPHHTTPHHTNPHHTTPLHTTPHHTTPYHKTPTSSTPACDPEYCTYNNQSGRCRPYLGDSFENVGAQECKQGCLCCLDDDDNTRDETVLVTFDVKTNNSKPDVKVSLFLNFTQVFEPNVENPVEGSMCFESLDFSTCLNFSIPVNGSDIVLEKEQTQNSYLMFESFSKDTETRNITFILIVKVYVPGADKTIYATITAGAANPPNDDTVTESSIKRRHRRAIADLPQMTANRYDHMYTSVPTIFV